jgi:hypothetical protein
MILTQTIPAHITPHPGPLAPGHAVLASGARENRGAFERYEGGQFI